MKATIQVIHFTGPKPYGWYLRGASAKNKRRRKKYQKVMNARKVAQEAVQGMKDYMLATFSPDFK